MAEITLDRTADMAAAEKEPSPELMKYEGYELMKGTESESN
jgi:hypothetical protein